MRVVIAGAGSVGRSIAKELIENGHQILLIDKSKDAEKLMNSLPKAAWLIADSCEMSTLAEAQLQNADIVVAATGDDKANLVTSLLAKTEFGVSRTVARVNHPKNEWMFDEAWGVDVAVSTPRIMSALIEEAVSVGELVQIFRFQQGQSNMTEFTLSKDSPVIGTPVGEVNWPKDTVLVCILRDQRPIAPSPDDTLEAHDELLLICGQESDETQIHALLGGAESKPGK